MGNRGIRNYQTKDTSSTTTSTSPSTTPTTSTKILVLEETQCSRSGNYMYAKGYVKNNSDRVLSYIKVKTVPLIV